jgi:membrane protease YdiL (CAAX protease family)
MPRSLLALLVACACLVAVALGLTLRRVAALERGELDHESAPRTLSALASAKGSTRISARLTTVTLQQGERATFEVCSADALEPARWLDALDLVVFRLSDMELMLRAPLDREHLAGVRRGAEGACLQLGGGVIEQSGRYALDAVWPSKPLPAQLKSVPLRARILGRTALSSLDHGYVVALFLGAALALLGFMTLMTRSDASGVAPTGDGEAPPKAPRRLPPTAGALVYGLVPLGLVIVLTQVPTASTVQTLGKGVLMVLVQALGPLALAHMLPTAPTTPWLTPPRRPLRSALAALLAAAVLVVVAQLALELVPATSEAPIQTFVSWPSGLLCFAALGVLLPLGEELLFRGHLWNAAQTLLGRKELAAAVTYSAFVLLHLQQSWGNWGGLVAIAVTGAVLTGLRIATGSVLVPALTHVLYNFALSVASF